MTFSFRRWAQQWWREIQRQKYKLLFSLVILLLVTMANVEFGEYTTRVGSAASHDLILDLIPPINLTFLFVYAWLAVVFLLFIYPLFFRVKKLPDTIFLFSLVVLIRGIFTTFTHLHTPLDAIPINFPWPFDKLAFENDLFFSGHTAIPLVGFYVFRGERIRYLFLALSIFLAATVLLMHQHYSIDVFAAYFIVYGIHRMDLVLKTGFDSLRARYLRWRKTNQ